METGQYKVQYSHPQNNYTCTIHIYSKERVSTPKPSKQNQCDINNWKCPTPLNSCL